MLITVLLTPAVDGCKLRKRTIWSWRPRVRIVGREQLIVLGTYPAMSLKQARDDAKRLLRDGIDPRARRRAFAAADPSDSFEAHARAWRENQKLRWSDVHSADVLKSMERDLFLDLGLLAVGAIEQRAFLAVLRKVEDRGAIETAHRLRQRADKVCRFAKSVWRRQHYFKRRFIECRRPSCRQEHEVVGAELRISTIAARPLPWL